MGEQLSRRENDAPPAQLLFPLFIKVSHIPVNGKDHITRTVSGDHWFLCCSIVEELIDAFHCCLRRLGLLEWECTDGRQKCAINSACVPIKFTGDLLHMLLLIFSNRSTRVIFGVLLLCTVFGFDVWIGGIMTVSWDDVIKLSQGFLKVRHHWQVDPFILIIPIQLNFHEFFPVKINVDVVIFFKRSDEVVQIIFVLIASKVVNHQDKLDWFGFVLPESWHSLALKISLFIQTLFELILAEWTGLR